MFKRGSLAHHSQLIQISGLMLLVFTGACLASFVGFILVKPFFGIDAFSNSAALFNYDSAIAIAALKFIQTISAIGIFILPVLYYAFLMDSGKKGIAVELKMARKPFVTISLLVIALMFCISPLIDTLTRLNEAMNLPESLLGLEQWMKAQEEQAAKLTKVFLQMDGMGSLLFNMVMIAIIPAIGEELLFRGAFQRIFQNWFGNPHYAIMLAAFIFSAIHFQFYGFLPRFALGVFLGYLFYWSNNLWLPILGHFINNGTAVFASYLSQRGIINYSLEEPMDLPFYIVILSIFLTAAGIYFIQKNSRETI